MLAEVWQTVLHHCTTIGDMCTVRLVERAARDGWTGLVGCASSSMYPRCTLIQTCVCMNCDRVCETHQIVYTHDDHPPRRILFCSHARCFVAAFKLLVDDCAAEQCYPFVAVQPSRPVWIPRTAGGRSVGFVRRFTPFYDDGTVVVEFCAEVWHDDCDVLDVPLHNKAFVLTKRVPLCSIDASHVHKRDIFASMFRPVKT